MCKELTRFEIAAVKRIAANTKTLRGKVEKLNAKIAELTTMKATYLNEIAMWESPIVDKYGYTVDQILDGTYLLPVCNEEVEEFEDNNDNLEYPSETFDNTL
jgi:uncharacterized protein YkvS